MTGSVLQAHGKPMPICSREQPGITDDVVIMVSEGNHIAVQFFARSRKPDGGLLFEVPLATS